MEQLPKERTSGFEPAFPCAGKDYFGPIWVIKPNKKTRFILGQKYYGVVFTCFTTRETPLELAEDLSTDLLITTGLRPPPPPPFNSGTPVIQGPKDHPLLNLAI